MNISFFQKNILLADFRTENIQSEKRRVKFTLPKEVQEPYACTEKVMAYQKGFRGNDFSEYRKAWGDPPLFTESTHYTSPSCQVMILTVKSGEIYRITRKSSSPMRDDCPPVIQGVFRKGVRAKEPMKHEIGVRPDRRPADIVEIVFSDGWTEEAVLTVSKPPQIVVQSEAEIIRNMNFRDASAYLLKRHEYIPPKTIQAGLLHLSEKHSLPEIQKKIGLRKTQTHNLINQFYEEFPKIERPTKKHGRKKVPFDDSWDQKEDIDT